MCVCVCKHARVYASVTGVQRAPRRCTCTCARITRVQLHRAPHSFPRSRSARRVARVARKFRGNSPSLIAQPLSRRCWSRGFPQGRPEEPCARARARGFTTTRAKLAPLIKTSILHRVDGFGNNFRRGCSGNVFCLVHFLFFLSISPHSVTKRLIVAFMDDTCVYLDAST